MKSLKIKVGNMNLEIPLGLIVGVIVVAVSLYLMIFKDVTPIDVWNTLKQGWKDFTGR